MKVIDNIKKICEWIKNIKLEDKVVIFFILLLMFITPRFFTYHSDIFSYPIFECIYNLMNGNIPLNLFICFSLLIVCVYWSKIIWKDVSIRLYRPLLVIFGFRFLWYSNFEYICIISSFDFRIYITILLSLISILLLSKILKIACLKPKEKQKDNKKGFSIDYDKYDNLCNVKISDTQREYAQVIINKLFKTDISNSSFAVGITGEWGTGKTTFLNLLEETAKEENNEIKIVHFNPWMCKSPEKVTSDFFATLQKELSPYRSTLSSSIRDYAKNLSVSLSSSIKVQLFPRIISLYDQKEKISKEISKFKTPVIIIIDDIDRLEQEEVFEVLRLIRNTGDLCNTIYLVAYDRKYVTTILNEKNIQNAESYLEKIFPIDIQMPTKENYEMWEYLKNEIEWYIPYNNFTNQLFTKIDTDKRILLLKVLNSYRKIKRFSRGFILNLDFCFNKKKQDYKILDLFWLEVLKFYDKKIYDILAYFPETLLYIDKNRFFLRYGISENYSSDDEGKKYKREIIWKEYTPKILEMMFGLHIDVQIRSISYIENFSSYFSFCIPPYKISPSELYEALSNKKTSEEVVKQWDKNKKSIHSIISRLEDTKIDALEYFQLKLYVEICLNLCLYGNDISEKIKEIFFNIHFKNSDVCKSYICEWFDKKINNNENLSTISFILNTFYQTTVFYNNNKVYDTEEHNTYGNLLINNNKINEYLKRIITDYLKNNPDLTALSIFPNNGILSELFMNCCLFEEEHTPDDFNNKYEQCAFDIVIEHFSSKKQKPSIKEYKKIYHNLFKEDPPLFESLQEEHEYYYYEEKHRKWEMKKYFGSQYNLKLKEYSIKCFSNE
ncbi:MAG: AAA family ATPase [Bacteroidales bacterium]|nr:AAA family ATPase [Bacteroidales bacterium]